MTTRAMRGYMRHHAPHAVLHVVPSRLRTADDPPATAPQARWSNSLPTRSRQFLDRPPSGATRETSDYADFTDPGCVTVRSARANSSPHGKTRPSSPPFATYSHSASVGRRTTTRLVFRRSASICPNEARGPLRRVSRCVSQRHYRSASIPLTQHTGADGDAEYESPSVPRSPVACI